ncbi:uncharacterized protein LOC126744168 [Anthonomus grandis grandis]|uniref:uncharacterized protein LOC126744168 n=1 Tax=Anthonomus grandis grandis TaxID=2921223 RepID=UPI00216524A7|nr:uncharacterized protein LOC126744168 [Anthonomus grandis grandis]
MEGLKRFKTERGELVTFVGIISATGNSLPSVYVFPRIRNIEEYLSDAPPLSLALGNKSGWMTKDLFVKALEHMVTHTKCNKENKLLLLLDNHESHTTLAAIMYAREHGIVHTSHRLQPLDVAVYSPFKTKCPVSMNEWMISNPGKTVTVKHIPKIIKQPFLQAFSPQNITSGFSKPGIWPVNSQSFTDGDFDGSRLYENEGKAQEKNILDSKLNKNLPSTSKEISYQTLEIVLLSKKL